MSAGRCIWAGLWSGVTLAAFEIPAFASSLRGVSACGWMALSWIVFASFPRRTTSFAWRDVALALAAFAPCAAYATLIDGAAGRDARSIALTLVIASVAIASLAAWMPNSHARRWSWPVALWWSVLFAGPTLEWAARTVAPLTPLPTWLVWSSGLSPLRWAIDRLPPDTDGSFAPHLGLGCALAVLFGLSRWSRATEGSAA